MSIHVDTLRLRLAGGPLPARALATALRVSQPTVSRALAGLGDEVVRFGAARSIQYALRDRGRGLPDTPPVPHLEAAAGKIGRLG
jgi:DNA-binding Lrp family transcriptional regulator